jgi:hypothetical protein
MDELFKQMVEYHAKVQWNVMLHSNGKHLSEISSYTVDAVGIDENCRGSRYDPIITLYIKVNGTSGNTNIQFCIDSDDTIASILEVITKKYHTWSIKQIKIANGL